MLFIYSLSVLWLSCCFCWGCKLCGMLKGRAAAAWHLGWSSHMNTGSPLQSSWPWWGAVFPCKLSPSHLPELSHPSQLPPKACNNTAKLIDTAAVRGPSFPLHSIPRIPNAALAWSGFSFPPSSRVRDGFQHRSARGAQEPVPWSHGSPPVSSSPLSPPCVALTFRPLIFQLGFVLHQRAVRVEVVENTKTPSPASDLISH